MRTVRIGEQFYSRKMQPFTLMRITLPTVMPTDRSTSDPVVTTTGNVTVKGNVFIQGAPPGEIGQTAL